MLAMISSRLASVSLSSASKAAWAALTAASMSLKAPSRLLAGAVGFTAAAGAARPAPRHPLQHLLGDRIDLLIGESGHGDSELLTQFGCVIDRMLRIQLLSRRSCGTCISPPTSQLSTIAITTASTGRFCVATVCRAELPVA